jgi:hypothetical protein
LRNHLILLQVLDKEDIVIEIDDKEDAKVRVENQPSWWFNPAALILESKEEDRTNPSPRGLESKDEDRDMSVVSKCSTEREKTLPGMLYDEGIGKQQILYDFELKITVMPFHCYRHAVF